MRRRSRRSREAHCPVFSRAQKVSQRMSCGRGCVLGCWAWSDGLLASFSTFLNGREICEARSHSRRVSVYVPSSMSPCRFPQRHAFLFRSLIVAVTLLLFHRSMQVYVPYVRFHFTLRYLFDRVDAFLIPIDDKEGWVSDIFNHSPQGLPAQYVPFSFGSFEIELIPAYLI